MASNFSSASDLSISNDLERSDSQYMNILQCVFCLQQDRQLKFLSCNHSSCMTCLQDQGDSIQCPRCCQKTDLDQGKELPSNFLKDPIESLVTFLEPKPCDLCQSLGKRTVSTSVCPECQGEALCDACVKIHHSMVATKSHTPVQIAVMLDGCDRNRPTWPQFAQAVDQGQVTEDTCKKHSGWVVDHYCVDCTMTACGACISEAHYAHACATIENLSRARREDFCRQLDITKVAMNEFQAGMRDAERQVDRTEMAAEDLINKIKERTELMVSLIKDLGEVSISEVKAMTKQHVIAGAIKMDNLVRFQVYAEDTQSLAEMFQRVSSDRDIVLHHARMNERVAELQKKLCQTTSSFPNVNFLTFNCSGVDETYNRLRPVFGNVTSLVQESLPVLLADMKPMQGSDRNPPKATGLLNTLLGRTAQTSLLNLNGRPASHQLLQSSPLERTAEAGGMQVECVAQVTLKQYEEIKGMDVDTCGDICVVGNMQWMVTPSITLLTFTGDGVGGELRQSTVHYDVACPRDIKTAGQDMYLADGEKKCVSAIQVTKDGTIGVKEHKIPMRSGFFTTPDTFGLAVDAAGNFFVCCRDTNIIYYWNAKAGTCEPYITNKEEVSLSKPYCMSLSTTGDLIVSEYGGATVCAYTPQKALRFVYGDCRSPCGVHTDALGHVYIADKKNDRVSVLSPTGELLTHLLTRQQHGIQNPAFMAMLPGGRHLVVAHSKNKLGVFKLAQ